MRLWNKEEFDNIFEDKRHLEAQLKEIQLKVIQDGYSEDLRMVENEFTIKLQKREK